MPRSHFVRDYIEVSDTLGANLNSVWSGLQLQVSPWRQAALPHRRNSEARSLTAQARSLLTLSYGFARRDETLRKL